MDDSTRNLIFKAIDQTISETEFNILQDAIEQDEDVRSEYLRAVSLGESLSEIAVEVSDDKSSQVSAEVNRQIEREESNNQVSVWRLNARLLAVAATVLAVVGGTAFWFGKNTVETTNIVDRDGQKNESRDPLLIAGHATLRRSVDLKWSDDVMFREGDVLPNGRLQFEEGVAEIDFFCGATLVVEGPASLNIESDWSVQINKGRLRANVPPAARGFVIKAAGSEIVDLGTEFALEVKSDNARVEVIDGEVKIRGGEHDGSHLLTGQRQWLKGSDMPAALDGLSTVDELRLRLETAASKRFLSWKVHSEQLRLDDRLVAYFPISATQTDRVVRNVAGTGERLDGKLVGPVESATGRFGPVSSGLDFRRPGSRVRTQIDGEFKVLTFACWVRIDSLEHVYNSLFMSDGYETGELHWQIRNDGRLMFSVMVDDTQSVQHFSELEQQVVETAGLARVYYSEPIWDISKSGQWFHLAAVYDPISRQVVQYANGKQVSREEIIDKFHIETLRIGAAEIGNWGQPFRKTPWFSVRNLNGTIDELAIFDTALDAGQITNLFQNGKPLGY